MVNGHLELKRDAALALKLTNEYGFDKWEPPWARKYDQGEKEEDEEGVTRSTRMIVAELQRIGVPATSDAADKIVRFHEDLIQMSTCLPLKRAQIPPVVSSSEDHCRVTSSQRHTRLTSPGSCWLSAAPACTTEAYHKRSHISRRSSRTCTTTSLSSITENPFLTNSVHVRCSKLNALQICCSTLYSSPAD